MTNLNIKPVLTLLFFVALQANAQKRVRVEVKPQKTNFTKYPLKARFSFFPFAQSSKIMLVSFDKRVDSTGYVKTKYSHVEYRWGLPILNDTICFSKLAQTLTLKISQVDTLTDIMYNTCFRWTAWDKSPAFCYRPHNAILFFDQSDKVFQYIEICFGCKQTRFSSDKIKRFEQCDYAIQDLRNYFLQLGVNDFADEFKTKATH